MNYKLILYTLLLFSFFVVSICGCNNTRTYSEEDVYMQNYIYYDKKSKQPITGLLIRKQNDAKTVAELDSNLRTLDPKDPVKYDFALFGLGVFEGF